ncbi:hypothetical protein C4K22_3186 [Pseudomonas chlororaphis subsp. aurantiaca]|uniref:Uncharacterized protein n=3 Tax=Pseudomonas chlororaphis TaxID=587753 RepID=A0AAP9W224_9PSED|nr:MULTISPECIES: hypothetical protein [Pseudomonas]AZC95843.1 hypothetical protein C4K28_3115 [Pseudomonas chlororaphis subsp. piscium]AZD35929.1 hypothetical protein C4K22_3186 [Pseudomonas chlororaphis subsp. aurantiaca]AZD42266.1 hypothetical protein C4K21_3192 [Pseudomonas chlororaphis subsp. aurantiaca]AZD60947.1 hypothetical protein C4K18_2974 [Pseudomonas chlororaphis subsp. aurantiaca]AZD73434.1 hypothetical protein C4K16_3074 [Pseudomonas chlororaphis subsp. aurantiaca]
MRPFLFSCLAVTLVSLAVYSIHSFYSLASFGSVASGAAASSPQNYPVASIGEVFRNF